MALIDRSHPHTAGRRSQRPRWRPPRPAAPGADHRRPPAGPAPAPAAAAPAAPAPVTPTHTPTALDQVSGGRLLFYDTRMALLLLNEARYRALEQVGVPREQANLVTVVGLGLLAQTVHERVGRVLHAPFAGTPADAVLPLAATRELLYGVAGPASRQTPYFGALVALAVAAHVSGPSIRSTVHSVRSAAQGTRAAFRRRYGRTPRRGPAPTT
ncbi:MAG TPA: hypothetical protein VFN87_04665 [Solirubrobacteraceae bacterium]|nr:hypothetical protein [Solirubrobacteraceae bacterium]